MPDVEQNPGRIIRMEKLGRVSRELQLAIIDVAQDGRPDHAKATIGFLIQCVSLYNQVIVECTEKMQLFLAAISGLPPEYYTVSIDENNKSKVLKE